MIDFKDTILLTGAGFTANFGGYLAKEMWSKIFNNPKLENARNIKLELRKNFDFENIYSKVFDNRNRFPDNENKIFKEVVLEAYLEMDEIVKIPFVESQGIHTLGVRNFFEHFTYKDNNRIGMCFTLNQDLYLERKFEWQPLGPQSIRQKGYLTGVLNEKFVDQTRPKLLPTNEELEIYKSQFQSFSEDYCFIKLHGSLDWITENGQDSKVIGINKIETINNIPLLKWYFELFQQALNRNNVKILIVGYGFKDQHINKCLYDAVKKHNLKIFIISPVTPDRFYFNLTHKYPSGSIANEVNDIGIGIWNGIEGYFPYCFKDIFPLDQSQTRLQSEIYKALGIVL